MSGIKNIPLGSKFGNLTVLSYAVTGSGFRAFWNCLCDCGKETIVSGSNLRIGRTRSCGHLFTNAGRRSSTFKDLSGKTFGKWFVLGPFEVRKSDDGTVFTFWLCRCSCGLEKFVCGSRMIHGRSACCRKCSKRLPSGESARRAVLQSYKDGAEKRGLFWELSDEQFGYIIKEDCFYCGTKPSNIRMLKSKNGDFTYSGIDRVNNSRGYEMGNVVSCCIICNRAKSTMTQEDFLSWIERAANHLRK